MNEQLEHGIWLGIIAGVLVTFYHVVGLFVFYYEIRNLIIIVTCSLSGPIGYIILGYILPPSKGDKYNIEKMLATGTFFLTGYFINILFYWYLVFNNYGIELFLLQFIILIFFIIGAFAGGLCFGSYFRQKLEAIKG